MLSGADPFSKQNKTKQKNLREKNYTKKLHYQDVVGCACNSNTLDAKEDCHLRPAWAKGKKEENQQNRGAIEMALQLFSFVNLTEFLSG